MKVDAGTYGSHNPYNEDHRVSRLRENLTSGSEGEGLETDQKAPRQSFTRQVFFKMCKQHLKLVKEIQLRDFDGLIGHTSMVFARYNILSWFQRQQVDQRSFGDLFRLCNEEMENIKFIDALKRIMQLAMAAMLSVRKSSEQLVQSMMEAVMGAAIVFFGLSENKSILMPEG